jgi:signal transduction histidine kinase
MLAGKAEAISGIKSQLMECFYNILDNSYEAVKEKMDYQVRDKSSFVPKISLKLSNSDRIKIIEISDNGIGIKKEDMGKIFDPFFTTKASSKVSTSVGMYVVKRMIEQHNNGRIWVESEYLSGTKVFVELPVNSISLQ